MHNEFNDSGATMFQLANMNPLSEPDTLELHVLGPARVRSSIYRHTTVEYVGHCLLAEHGLPLLDSTIRESSCRARRHGACIQAPRVEGGSDGGVDGHRRHLMEFTSEQSYRGLR